MSTLAQLIPDIRAILTPPWEIASVENPMSARRISATIEVGRLDRAVQAAAESSGAVVVDYIATPNPLALDESIEIAVEFLILPKSQEKFVMALRNKLGVGTRSAPLEAPIVHSLPPGTLHQWRFAWRQTQAFQRSQRWTDDRALLQSVLRQAEQGHREIHHV